MGERIDDERHHAISTQLAGEFAEGIMFRDQIAIVARGRIVAGGSPDELVAPGESLEQYFMRIVGGGGADPISPARRGVSA